MKFPKKYLFFIILALFAYLFCCMHNSADRDLWHRLAVGKIFFENGLILKHDIFSYTEIKDLWIDHEWGAGVLFYFLLSHFGDLGLVSLKIAGFFSVIFLIYKTINLTYTNNKYKILYYLLIVLALCPGYTSSVRSQVFTYTFFALWLYLLERIRLKDENRLFWIFPATMLIWANVHGGFLSGLGLLFLYGVGELINNLKVNPKKALKYFVTLFISALVTLINPYGINYWSYMFEAATMKRPHITEWLPLNPLMPINEWLALKILIIIAIISLLHLFIRKKKEINWSTLIIFVVTTFLMLKHQRHVAFFVIASSIFSFHLFYEAKEIFISKLKNNMSFLEKFFEKDLVIFAKDSIIFLFFFFMGISLALQIPYNIYLNPKIYPIKAIDYIKVNNIKGNLLVPFNWGTYALWKLYPQNKVSIDGRYEEVYTNQAYKENCDFIYAEKEWQTALKKYHNDVILVAKKNQIYKKMQTHKEWKKVYEDKYSAIYLPKNYPVKNLKEVNEISDYSKEMFSNNINLN